MVYKHMWAVRMMTIVIAFAVSAGCSGQKTNLNVADFEKAIKSSSAQLVDVRTLEEYESGHLSNSLLADWTQFEEFKKRVSALDKSKPVYAYCLSGARSDAAVQWLRKQGFEAYNMQGGIAAWRRNNKPIEQKVKVKQISMQEYLASVSANKTVLVDFGAEWCPPCKKMNPVLDSLVATHGKKFQLVKIDGGAQTEILKPLRIEGFPTFILYRQGKEVWRKEGLVALSEFQRIL